METQTQVTTTTHTTTITTVMLTSEEQKALEALRARFLQDHDLFSDRELAHLQFLRWLYTQGVLAS